MQTVTNRRRFMQSLGSGALAAATLTGATLGSARGAQAQSASAPAAPPSLAVRPNILWISIEDTSPDLGCYGDAYATTPTLDQLAADGVRFANAFTTAGVCAPVRTGVVSGMYADAIGTGQMRCKGVPPAGVKCFPEFIRAQGYWCGNNSKTDYQFSAPASAWDACDNKAHWRQRRDPAQPFFCIRNLGTTHESRIRAKYDALVHDPDQAQVPPYYPNTPVTRRDWARCHDNVTTVDHEIAGILAELKADGLADSTIVFFWGDHGRGLPRGKRWIYDSGIHIPLIIRVPAALRALARPDAPEALAPGTVCDDLVSSIDFGPTVISLVGAAVPAHMLGRPFLGSQRAAPRPLIFAARDRMDETYDIIRAARDKRFKYIRNFMPHVPRSQDIDYMNQMPTMQEMRRLHAEGKLEGPQLQFFEPVKPLHELYDTASDPHEVNNLAADPAHRETLAALQRALREWMLEIGDVGLIPEPEMENLMRPGGQTPKVAAPGAQTTPEGRVALTCATPGASIVWRPAGAAAGTAAAASAPTAKKDPSPAATVPDQPAAASAPPEGTRLPVTKAARHGEGLNLRGEEITSWRDEKTWLSWEADLPAGDLMAYVLQANQAANGAEFEIVIGDQRATGATVETGDWTQYRTVAVGPIAVARAGRQTIELRPTKKPGRNVMNLREIVLAPASAAPPAGALTAAPPARDRKNKADKSATAPSLPWRLYVDPIAPEALAKAGESIAIEAMACRAGFADSPKIRYAAGAPALAPADAAPYPEWRELIDQSGLLTRLLDLKEWDDKGPAAAPVYFSALADEAPAMRFWAVIGLRAIAREAGVLERAMAAIAPLLADPSASVRIAAAEALWQWDQPAEARPVLLAALQDPAPRVGLLAAQALSQLGERIRPALEEIRQAQKQQKDSYAIKRIKNAIARLEAGAKAGPA